MHYDVHMYLYYVYACVVVYVLLLHDQTNISNHVLTLQST